MKRLFGLLVGLLIIGVVLHTASALPTASVPKDVNFKVLGDKVIAEGRAFKLYNGTMVAVDDEGPSKYYIPLEKFPLYLRGSKIIQEISEEFIKTGKINYVKLELYINNLEQEIGKSLTPKQREKLKKLIIENLKKEKELTEIMRDGNMPPIQPLEDDSPYIPDIIRENLPTIYQPWIDITGGYVPGTGEPFEGHNEIIAVYWYPYWTSDGHLEKFGVTIVYKDEDAPDRELDILYDQVRVEQFGRIEDIEVFFVYPYTNKAEFKGTYSSWWQTFFAGGDHLTGTNTYNKQVFINTWNHLMSSKYDTNPVMPKKAWTPSSYWNMLKYGDYHRAHCDYSSQC